MLSKSFPPILTRLDTPSPIQLVSESKAPTWWSTELNASQKLPTVSRDSDEHASELTLGSRDSLILRAWQCEFLEVFV